MDESGVIEMDPEGSILYCLIILDLLEDLCLTLLLTYEESHLSFKEHLIIYETHSLCKRITYQ